MRVFYAFNPYRSFARVAQQYKEAIGRCALLTSDLGQADVAILHCEPHRFPEAYERNPMLKRKYVIGCTAWEASPLPASCRNGLKLVQELWTCSHYCYELFAPYHSVVTLIPHIIERNLHYTEVDLRYVRESISYNPDYKYALVVTRMSDPRKNIPRLVRAFNVFNKQRQNCRLIVKSFGVGQAIERGNTVMTILEDFTNEQMNALYSSADLYVSAHHSEGWGLTISDAILFRLPIVATAYSGNTEYLLPEHSYLIPCTPGPIGRTESQGLFEESMIWAHVSERDIVQTLERAYNDVSNGAHIPKVDKALIYAQRFNASSVQSIICNRLNAIERKLRGFPGS